MTAVLGRAGERYRASTSGVGRDCVRRCCVDPHPGLWASGGFAAGRFLHLTSATVGSSTVVDRTVNVGLDVWTSGGGTTIDAVDGSRPPPVVGLRIRFVGVARPTAMVSD